MLQRHSTFTKVSLFFFSLSFFHTYEVSLADFHGATQLLTQLIILVRDENQVCFARLPLITASCLTTNNQHLSNIAVWCCAVHGLGPECITSVWQDLWEALMLYLTHKHTPLEEAEALNVRQQ